MWRLLHTRSILAFASPELEALFQEYDTASISFLACVGLLLAVTLYLVLLVHVFSVGAPYRSLLPPLALPLLLHLLPCAAVLMLFAFIPGFYRKYRPAISFILGGGFMLAFHDVRQVQLWLRLINPGTHGSLLATVQGFIAENIYLSVMWFCVSGHPAGPLVDVLLAMGLLLCGVGGNAAICASPLWPAQSVTMSSGMIGVAKSVTSGLWTAVFPMFLVRTNSHVTCRAALAFWQVVGSWWALTFAFLMELARRTAFLRTTVARAWICSRIGPASVQCPLTSYLVTEKALLAMLCLTLAHIAGLAVVMDLFSE